MSKITPAPYWPWFDLFVLLPMLLLICTILWFLTGCEIQHHHEHTHNYGTEPIIPRDKDGRIVIQIKPVRPERQQTPNR